MRRSLDVLGDDISTLSWAHGIALYVARHPMDGSGDGWHSGVRWLVLGTPLYVEQSK